MGCATVSCCYNSYSLDNNICDNHNLLLNLGTHQELLEEIKLYQSEFQLRSYGYQSLNMFNETSTNYSSTAMSPRQVPTISVMARDVRLDSLPLQTTL